MSRKHITNPLHPCNVLQYDSTMNTTAVGAYLRACRENRGLSKEVVCNALEARGWGVNVSTLYRLERGKGYSPRSGFLFNLIDILGASVTHVYYLSLNPNATEADAINLAGPMRNERSKLHPDILSIAQQMTDYQLGQWVEMGRNLISRS